MSMLHRSLLAQIMTAIDPILEVGLTVVNPAIGAGSKLVLTDLEHCVEGDESAPAAPAPQAPTQTLPTGFASPLPAAAAPVVAPQLSGLAPTSKLDPAAAPAPLSAQDVIAALMATLQGLSTRV